MKIRELKELLELISERNITEFELEEEGMKLRIRKGFAVAETAAGASGVAAGSGASTSTSTAPPRPAEGGAFGEGADAAEDGLLYVTSPMVGTFYRQPEPGAEPFAREGDTVTKGQVLCIIEAMKLMNEIECEHQGELVKAYVDNGQAVQYGDRLFAIRGA